MSARKIETESKHANPVSISLLNQSLSCGANCCLLQSAAFSPFDCIEWGHGCYQTNIDIFRNPQHTSLLLPPECPVYQETMNAQERLPLVKPIDRKRIVSHTFVCVLCVVSWCVHAAFKFGSSLQLCIVDARAKNVFCFCFCLVAWSPADLLR